MNDEEEEREIQVEESKNSSSELADCYDSEAVDYFKGFEYVKEEQVQKEEQVFPEKEEIIIN